MSLMTVVLLLALVLSPALGDVSPSSGPQTVVVDAASGFACTYFTNSTGSLAISLTYPSSGYGAIGLAASGMVGSIIICFHNSGSPWCNTYVGSNYGVAAAANMASLQSSQIAGSMSTTNFTVAASSFGVQANTSQRVIFAFGAVLSGTTPQQHTASNRFPLMLTLNSAGSGGGQSPATPFPTPSVAPMTPVPTGSTPVTKGSGSIAVSTVGGAELYFDYVYDPELDKLNCTLTYPPGGYGAVGISSSGMVGTVVSCHNDGISVTQCNGYGGVNFDISPVDAAVFQLQLLRSSRNASLSTSTFQVNASAFGLSKGMAAGNTRTIFATGALVAGVPEKHYSTTKYSVPLRFGGGAAPSGPTIAPAIGGSVVTQYSYNPLPSMSFAWSASNGSGMVNVTLAFSEGQYGAIGASSSGMLGPMILCSVSFPTPGCYSYNGANFDVSISNQQTIALFSISRTTSGTTAAFQIPAGYFADVSGSARYIFAFGSVAAGVPQQHPDAGFAAQLINLATGSIITVPKNYLVGWLILLLTVVAWAVGGRILLNNYNTTRHEKSLKLFLVFSILVCAAILFALYVVYYRENGETYPEMRSFGQVTAMFFVLIMIPICKHSGLMGLAGIAYERAVWLHPVLALLLYLFMTTHMIGMMVNVGFAESFQWEPKCCTTSTLAGVLSWIFLTVMGIAAMMRRKFFALFKYSHLMFLLVFVFGALHYPTLALMLIPGVLLWMTDWILRMRTTILISPEIRGVQYFSECEVVRVVVRGVSWPMLSGSSTSSGSGGEYACIRISELGQVYHPFSVALYHPEAQTATFYIKTIGKWTTELARISLKPELTVAVQGCYGNLQTPLNRHTFLVFICGGIGVTPMLRMLQLLAADCPPKLEAVIFAWSVRSDELMDVIYREMSPLIGSLASKGVAVELRFHNTRKNEPRLVHPEAMDAPFLLHGNEGIMLEDLLLQDDLLGSANTVASLSKRTELPTVVTKRLQPEDIIRDVASRLLLHDDNSTVGVYVCGPEALSADVRAAVSNSSKAFELHVESFEL
jgi:predicted ferric reductase